MSIVRLAAFVLDREDLFDRHEAQGAGWACTHTGQIAMTMAEITLSSTMGWFGCFEGNGWVPKLLKLLEQRPQR